jgi:MFS transporter, PPP family, 3-phenylpropionic acid transporter
MRALTYLLGNRPPSSPLGVRIAAFFGALFLAYGVTVPYFPVWLHARGLDAFQISTITAAPLFLRTLVTPSIGLLADRLGDYRIVILGLATGAFTMILGLGLASGYVPILILGVAFLMMNGTMVPLIETVAVRGVRSDGLDYGRMRLWGSMTFIVANFLGGLAIEAFGGGVALWMIGAAIMLTIAASYALPRASRAAPAPARGRIDWRSSGPARLLRSRLFVLFLIAIGCIHGAHATFYTFGALYWQSHGLSAAWVGTLWAIGVFAEVMVFAFSAPVVRRFGPLQLIAAGAGASVLRWTAMAFDPPLYILVPLQVLHALTYGATHLGAILFITRAVPHAAMGTAQAFYSTIAAGLLLGVVGLISGALYSAIGGLVFLVPAMVAAVGLVAAILLLREWPGTPFWGDAGEGISPTTQVQEA